MTEEELRSLISDALSGEVFNTNEKVADIRKAVQATYALQPAYDSEDTPMLLSLEVAWKLLEPLYEEINRLEEPMRSPLSSFSDYVFTGFYPPPEIMIALAYCFECYMNKAGDISLDEAFFDQSHKKRSSYAFKERNDFKYLLFDMAWVDRKFGKQDSDYSTMEALAEGYWNHRAGVGNWEDNIDIESFLRGYRRFKKGK